MSLCTFCGTSIPRGTGKMYVRKDAKIQYFCSRKCEKNLLELKRNPRKVTHTAAAKQEKTQRMAALAHEEEKEAEEAPTPKPAKSSKKKTAKKSSKQKEGGK